jgi:hypothetical protein
MGLSTPWLAPVEARVRLRALVDLRQHERHQQETAFGRLDAVLACHWPEFGQWMDVREQQSALELLTIYPRPARVTQEPEAVKSLLRKASRSKLSEEAVRGVIEGAQTTTGVPMVPEEEHLVHTLVTHLVAAGRSTKELEERMRDLAQEDETFARLSSWMGVYTAAAILTRVDPLQYASARQLEKACGLNLREKSSGEKSGRITITKRGSGLVRQLLYLFALRMLLESTEVRAWYERRRGYTEDSKERAVVALMRKLVRAMFHVARGHAFDAAKLFDLRRLDLERKDIETKEAAAPVTAPPSPKPMPRTTPRPIARGRKGRGANRAAQALA